MVKPVREADAFEKGVRLVCGALLGFLFFGPLAYNVVDEAAGMWVMIAVGVVLFALLAVRYGDRFWISFAERFRTWWPFWP